MMLAWQGTHAVFEKRKYVLAGTSVETLVDLRQSVPSVCQSLITVIIRRRYLPGCIFGGRTPPHAPRRPWKFPETSGMG